MPNARGTALKVLYKIEKEGAYINLALKETLANSALTREDRALVTELTHGVVKWRLTLDYTLSKHSRIKLNKISPWVLCALRMGVYQILFLDKIPVSAAVNESVKLAKRYGGPASGGFVNGVLRSVVRGGKMPALPDDPIEALCVQYSCPKWIVKYWIDAYGKETAQAILQAFLPRPALCVRCNTLKTSPNSLLQAFLNAGMEAERVLDAAFPNLDCAIKIRRASNLLELPAYQAGWFYVQDLSSMLAVEALDPKPGGLVLDVCAAPGGKTTYIAQKMQNRGKVVAFDIYEHKLSLIAENASRLGIDCVECILQDASVFNERFVCQADAVLVDAPCSGLGVIGRKPDIKYAGSMQDIDSLAAQGLSILETAARYVRLGGTLVYSLCTLSPKEGEQVIAQFLAQHKEFCLSKICAVNLENNGQITLFPQKFGTDGFFICKMKREI